MDRDEDLLEAPDLTNELTIVRYIPVFVGTYSCIYKGLHRGEAVSCAVSLADRLRLCQVAIKVLMCSSDSLPAMKRVGESIN
jgi:hypothetical protein